MSAYGNGTSRLAQMLYLWRTVNRLTLRDVARETGIGHATIMRIERGHEIDLATFLKLLTWFQERIGDAPRKRAATKDGTHV